MSKIQKYSTIRRLLIFMGLLAIVMLLWQVPPRISSALQINRLPSEVRVKHEALPSELGYSSIHEEIMRSGAAVESIGTAKSSTCYIGIVGGGGWVTGGYSHSCFARITAGYYTDLDIYKAREVLTRLNGKGQGRDHIFISDAIFPGDCTLSRYDSAYTIRYAPVGSASSKIDDTGYLQYEECGRHSSVLGLRSVMSAEVPSVSFRTIDII